MLRSGDVVAGRYRVLWEIGHGGMGTIYLGEHLNLQKRVVLKRVNSGAYDMSFLRTEADLLKNLHHPYLPQIYDFVVQADEVYTVMDYVEGVDFGHIPCGPRNITEAQAVKWFSQLAEVLSYLHDQAVPIIHSDIKPENIILTPAGNICLIDFNISLSGQAGELFGFSREFASPEQMQMAAAAADRKPVDLQLDPRTDIYSAGAVIFYLLTGNLPQAGMEISSLPGLPYSPGLCAVVEKCTKSDRHYRFKNAKSLKTALGNLRKQDARYSQYLLMQILACFCCTVLSVSGIYLFVSGERTIRSEKYNATYNIFCDAVQDGDDNLVISCGLELLNDPLYREIEMQNPSEKAFILHGIGVSYQEQGNTAAAASCYSDALALASAGDNNLEAYYLDYALILAEDGRMVEAESVLKNAESVGISENTVLLIRAELLVRQENFSEALQVIQEILMGSASDERKSEACMLAAYAVEEDSPEQILWMKRAKDYYASPNVLRQLGASCLNRSQVERSENERTENLQTALACYLLLCERKLPTLEDKLGAAASYYFLEKYQDAKQLLLSCVQEAKGDYRPDMYLALVYHAIGDDASAVPYCNSAFRKIRELPAEKSTNSAEQDKEILEDLQKELVR